MSKTNGEKRIYRTIYRQSWEKNPMLRDWIESVPDQPDKAFCRFCKRLLYAHRYSVLKHTCTTKHQQNADKFKEKISKSADKAYSNSQKHVDVLYSTHQVVDVAFNKCDATEIPIDEDEGKTVTRGHKVVTRESEQVGDEFLTFMTPCVEEIEDNGCAEEEPDDTVECEEYHFEPVDEHQVSSRLSPDNMSQNQPTISTHILDTSLGKAAANVPVTLFKLEENIWKEITQNRTNTDGRVPNFGALDGISIGSYKLHFDTFTYFNLTTSKFLYPFIEIVFNIDKPEHYHIPLLLNPFGYSTYRGT